MVHTKLGQRRLFTSWGRRARRIDVIVLVHELTLLLLHIPLPLRDTSRTIRLSARIRQLVLDDRSTVAGTTVAVVRSASAVVVVVTAVRIGLVACMMALFAVAVAVLTDIGVCGFADGEGTREFGLVGFFVLVMSITSLVLAKLATGGTTTDAVATGAVAASALTKDEETGEDEDEETADDDSEDHTEVAGRLFAITAGGVATADSGVLEVGILRVVAVL